MPKGVAAQANGRYQNDATYDRITTIFELNCSKCCFIITRTPQQSSKVLHNVDDWLFVGATARVVEPVFSQRFLGNDTSNPILEIEKPLEPVNNEPDVPVQVQDDRFSTGNFYFCLQPMPLLFTKASLAHPTCSGILCDGKSCKTSCSCIDTKPHGGFSVV